MADGAAQLVWITGAADVRLHDHSGFLAAAATGAPIKPLCVLDPDVHLKYPPLRLERLHRSLSSLDSQLQSAYGARLAVAVGPTADVLSSYQNCETCHVIADDVEREMRASQRAGCAALESSGVTVARWDHRLRATSLPDTELCGYWQEYSSIYSKLALIPPATLPDGLTFVSDATATTLPTLASLQEMASSHDDGSTAPPHAGLALDLCDHTSARAALAEYAKNGRDAFADARLANAYDHDAHSPPSLHAAAGQRLLAGDWKPSAALSLREAPTRAFSAALGVGALSAREVRAAAATADDATSLEPMPKWGRESADALADVVEWSEWYELLARRSLARQEVGRPATSGGERQPYGGDAREAGEVAYWRWQGQHLVRYLSWEAGDAYDGTSPALLLVHGFAASAEQWERLVHSLRAEAKRGHPEGKDSLPPIYAIDLVGFGHSEKPDLSYTQYVWESQIVDFVAEVMGGRDVVLAGNSIGGGLSAGASASIPSCKGVVLCNTAGVLLEPSEYEAEYDGRRSVREATLAGESAKEYAPVPLLGPPALELFGQGIIGLLYGQIPKLLDGIYSDRPQNADAALAFAIAQGAASPGSPNVIGSGAKLADNRPLNEVLSAPHGFGGPVLMLQGLNDKVSGAARAAERADVFERMRPGVEVARVADGGHCVQDDAPDAAAAALLRWLKAEVWPH